MTIRPLSTAKTELENAYTHFWEWFAQNQEAFYDVIKNKGNIPDDFFSHLEPKLNEIKEGYWFLAGMYDDETAELILTADGIVKNIAFIEELVAKAPTMKNWKITALKRPSDISQFGIQIGDYKFDGNKMFFYATTHASMPDEIDITITHEDYTEENKDIMGQGIFLMLDNALGELRGVSIIDGVTIISPKDATEELVPMNKLKDFLVWREKEFIEKYEGFRYNTEEDSYSALEATLSNDLPLVAIINTGLLKSDSKASHPWVAILEVTFEGDENGMPSQETYELLNEMEDTILEDMKDVEGYLNIGRQTANSTRELYFACIDFRKPSKVLHFVEQIYGDRFSLSFDVYKDKYWQSFERFNVG